MKKILVVVGAVSVFSGAVQAQSSVSIYGIIDAGYVGGNSRVVSPTTGAQTKTTVNLFGQNAESSSRLGFRGNEDLGGGTSAFFTAEVQLYPQDATLSGSSNGGFFNRQTFVGLKKLGLGESAVGLQYTPIFKATLVTDPGNLNNLTGNLIYASTQGIGSTSAGSTAIGFTARTANTISFKTEKFAGFSVSGMYTLNNQNQSQASSGSSITGGNVNASGWGLSSDYTYNKLYITAAYQALKQQTTAVTSLSDSAVWTNASANTLASGPFVRGNALNVEDNQFYAASTYDFGVLKAYAQYLTRKAASTLSTNYYLGRSAQQLGLRGYLTSNVEGWVSAGVGRYSEMGQGSPTANFNGWQLGSNYWFSKRTNLYAIYGQTNVSNGTTATGVTTSANLNNYALGMRHTF
jgi:predicted porin